MTMPVTLESAPRPRVGTRLVTMPVVGIARILATATPLRPRTVLSFVRRGARPATEQEALTARLAVVGVSTRCAGQQCLQRSIATALLCRLRGTWPEWRTGVRTEPFRAHAWVAVDGQPVGEAEDLAHHRTVIVVPPVGEKGDAP